jgi:hypothetical protein
MLGVVLAFVTELLLVVMVAVLPPMARCPDGWSLGEGVRRATGEFACYAPVPRDCGEPKGPYERPCPRSERYYGRIYCTGGKLAIVVDHRTVGCQR